MKKVAVVGAGISGLLAAQVFKDKGWQVKVYEKARGRSGRMTTKRFRWGQADLGAQYFTARDDSFIRLCHEWQREEVIAPWKITPWVWDADGLRASGDDILRFVGTPSMGQLCRHLSRDLEIRFEARVSQLQRLPDKRWRLAFEDGGAEAGFDWVVLSAPAAQTRALLPESSRIKVACDDVLLPCWAQVLQITETRPHIQGVFARQQGLSWLSLDSSKPGRNGDGIYVLHFGPIYSEATQDKDEVFKHSVEVLTQILDTSVEVLNQHSHFWRYAPVKRDWSGLETCIDEDMKLAVVGDWTPKVAVLI